MHVHVQCVTGRFFELACSAAALCSVVILSSAITASLSFVSSRSRLISANCISSLLPAAAAFSAFAFLVASAASRAW